MVEQIGDARERVDPALPDLPRCALEAAFDGCAGAGVGVVDTAALGHRAGSDAHVEPGIGERMRAGLADPPARAGHQRDAAMAGGHGETLGCRGARLPTTRLATTGIRGPAPAGTGCR